MARAAAPPMTTRQAKRAAKKKTAEFEYTASQMRRADRIDELEARRQTINDKHNKRLQNKRKRDEQAAKESARKRQMLTEGKIALEDTWGKVTASQPRLNNFFSKTVTRPQPRPSTPLKESPDTANRANGLATKADDNFASPLFDSQEDTLVDRANGPDQAREPMQGHEFSEADLLQMFSSQLGQLDSPHNTSPQRSQQNPWLSQHDQTGEISATVSTQRSKHKERAGHPTFTSPQRAQQLKTAKSSAKISQRPFQDNKTIELSATATSSPQRFQHKQNTDLPGIISPPRPHNNKSTEFAGFTSLRRSAKDTRLSRHNKTTELPTTTPPPQNHPLNSPSMGCSLSTCRKSSTMAHATRAQAAAQQPRPEAESFEINNRETGNESEPFSSPIVASTEPVDEAITAAVSSITPTKTAATAATADEEDNDFEVFLDAAARKVRSATPSPESALARTAAAATTIPVPAPAPTPAPASAANDDDDTVFGDDGVDDAALVAAVVKAEEQEGE